MESKPYPVEKRRILLQRNTDDFVSFLNEVKTPEGKRFIRHNLLPNQVPGFRKGRAPLTQTVPKLINNLMKEVTNTNSVIWDKFKNAWIAWVESHHQLNDILLDFDNGKDFDDTHNCVAPPNSELDVQCFNILLESSRNNQIDQETIRRFYEFGYFLPSEKIEALIGEALPRTEIERQQRMAELPDLVDKLSETIDSLSSRVSDIESSDERTEEFNQRMTEVIDSFEAQLSEAKANFNKSVGQLKRAINSRLSKIEDSVKSIKTHVSDAEFLNNIRQEISHFSQHIQESVQSHGARLDGLDRKVTEIRTEKEEQRQITNAPRIANQAVRIGECFDSQLRENTERYSSEEEYLSDFEHCLRRFGVIDDTDSAESAAVIHLALKSFPAMETTDARIIDAWRLVCDNHVHVTNISVEMGWIGLQDWFPRLFSLECFGEQLSRVDLDISIKKMLETGDLSWAIHLSNCDRSFPESYLPGFLKWINGLSEGSNKVFLTRCLGENRCEKNQDIYEWVACLPKPHGSEPILARKLKPSGVIVTRSQWESWCCPTHHTSQFELLNQLQEASENAGVQIPIIILREIQRYLELSHNLLEASRALDWALTLRLLPWIAYHRELIDAMRDLMDQENRELPHFRKALLQAREESE